MVEAPFGKCGAYKMALLVCAVFVIRHNLSIFPPNARRYYHLNFIFVRPF
jgi:hypothetical protein